jgi:aspartyl-tRNA(Asn)/glutamyl-tRNA(Gln) amidotransferase subunit A
MAGQEWLWLPLSDLAAQIQRKKVSPVELTGAVLERLEHLNTRLNAFITTLGEQVLQAAQRAEQDVLAGRRCGPLHGVPLALKDIFAMRGVRMTAGSQALASWVPDEDATVLARLKAAGAIFVGTLNLYEFATGAVMTPGTRAAAGWRCRTMWRR